MGGSGSGRRWGWSTKGIIDECLALDVRRLKREGLLNPGQSYTWQWTCRSGRKDTIGIFVGEGRIDLSYSVKTGDGESQNIDYSISLTYTGCNYGGQRPWFVCPHCGRRVAKLYLDRNYFRCRVCHDLGYQTQREQKVFRLLHKAQNIREKLGGDGNMFNPFPFKPKGMHWRTYDRYRRKYDTASNAMISTMGAKLILKNER